MLYRSLLKLWWLPPLLNVMLVIAGLLLLRRYRKTGLALCAAGLGSLVLLSMPQVSNQLLRSIEVAPALSEQQVQQIAIDNNFSQPNAATPAVTAQGQPAQGPRRAIVMLGAGHREFAAEYGGAYPEKDAVARLNYTAWLHRKTGLPVMLTGGTPSYSQHAHADVLAGYLQQNYGIDAAWLEKSSRTTWENASNAAAILLPEDISSVVLVTQSLHMRRAIQLFEAAGFQVIPAPTALSFNSSPATEAWRWLPSSRWLHDSAMVLHEILGYWWYRLRPPG